MEEVGGAVFKSFPGEAFRFGVTRAGDVATIWLESQVSKKRWECVVTDMTQCAPTDVVLPQDTVLRYVAASLKESAGSSDSGHLGPNLVRNAQEGDGLLRLEVLVKLGVPDFAWAPKYVFPMALCASESPPSPPENLTADRIDQLTTQVEELQNEVKTLKAQMQVVFSAQAQSVQAQSLPASPPSSTTGTGSSSAAATPNDSPTGSPKRENSTEKSSESTLTSRPSRKDQVWGDIIGHPQHELAQTTDYRETRNSFGVMVRKHRQRSCKVCSVLRGDRKRAFETSYYCVECTERHKGAMVSLCDKARPHSAEEYRNATCSQIWHVMWNNGASIPHGGISSIRMRKKLKTSEPVAAEDAASSPSSSSAPVLATPSRTLRH